MGQLWLENGVIVKDTGGSIQYHPRCPNCGHVDNMLTAGGHVGNGIIASLGTHRCNKCGKIFETRGGRN